MKTKILPLSFPLLLLFTAPTVGSAYVGTESYSLEEDWDYRRLKDNMNEERRKAEVLDRNARDASAMLHHKKRELEQNALKLQNLPSQLAQLNQQIQGLLNQINAFKAENQKLQQALSHAATDPNPSIAQQLQAKIQQNNQQIAANEAHIEKVKQSRNETARVLEQSQRNRVELEASINSLSHELERVQSDARRQLDYAHRAISDFERFSRELEMDIERFNSAGATEGASDGRYDGREMAQSLGSSSGYEDGTNDGFQEGTSAGRRRDYDRGQGIGLDDGKRDGIQKGTQAGKNQGIEQALIDIGAQEGTAMGISLAQKSDANLVGEKQGQEAGLKRSIATGNKNGVKIAEAEGLKNHESKSLHKVEINGAFSGLFSRTLPHLATNYRGRNYSASPSYGREIVRKAYVDGYNTMYQQTVIAEFENNVAGFYNSAYDNAFHRNYDSAVAKTYEDSYNSGYHDGYNTIFSKQFEQSRRAQYAVSYKETADKPDRESSTFKNSYKANQTAAYNKLYEEIRVKNFNSAELATFNKNIQQKTEEAKVRRTAEIDALFANHPILSFVSSEVHDGGVDGVTKSDGVFQPGETVVHSITIKNFGSKPLAGATVVSSTGQSQKLPEIPAQSEVVIKGAVISKIDTKLAPNSVHQSAIRIAAPFTSADKLQAVHFSKASENLLVDSEIKKVKAFYPIFMASGYKNDFTSLKINQIQPLHLSLLNTSDVIYNDIDVVMTSNSSTELFLSKFKQIAEVNSGLDIEDAKLMPSRHEVGKTIELRGVLKYKGITVGVIERPLVFKVVK